MPHDAPNQQVIDVIIEHIPLQKVCSDESTGDIVFDRSIVAGYR